MIQNEALDTIIDKLLDRNLGEAIVEMENFLSVHPHQINSDRLHAIKTDYQMMADYWRRGFKDPQLPDLYDNLLRRMYVLYANIVNNYMVRHTPFLKSLADRARLTLRDWSPQVVKEELESYVLDVAVSELDSFGRGVGDVRASHHTKMIELFDYILTSGPWTDGYAEAMEIIVLSDTVDTIDQQIILSSVMLANMNIFDMAKFRMMMHVYMHATDEHVRQRALVGWVFSMDSDIGLSIYPEENQLVEKLLENPACCRELVELQKQLIYCMNAENDHKTINEEIMPDLIQNRGSGFTGNGIIEEHEDELNDILHPDAEEEKLERLERSYNKMMDMQRRGSDIYFGGFFQMKRFPFFNELINWFVPFYIEHPDLNTFVGSLKKNRFISDLLKGGVFCDSDKYSFVLAYQQVMQQIPQDVREMMERGEAVINEFRMQDTNQPEYIRRIYLQDLYRFFRIFQQREVFRNIFDTEHYDYMFLSTSVFRSTQIETSFNEITAFLIKQKRMKAATYMLNNYGENRQDFQFYMMSAYVGICPLENYKKAVELQPDNQRALAGYARALFNAMEYEESLDAYEKLLAFEPNKHSYLLNKAVCLTNLERYDEAENMLFRLNYDTPEDASVNRALAWTLTCSGKYDQAEKIYSELISNEAVYEGDLLNYGFCLWFKGNVDDAADCFHRYMKESGESKSSIMESEWALIREKGITEPEIQMMLYIL